MDGCREIEQEMEMDVHGDKRVGHTVINLLVLSDRSVVACYNNSATTVIFVAPRPAHCRCQSGFE